MASSKNYSQYVSVALDLYLDKLLDYGLDELQALKIKKGMMVEVPVRNKLYKGYVVAIKEKPDFSPVKQLSSILTEQELIQEDLFDLAYWMSKYYCAPLSQVIKIMLPASVRKQISHKQQLYVLRAKSKEFLQNYCQETRNTYPAQAQVLDVLLQVKKGILLSELLEQTQGSRSPVDALVKKKLLLLDIVRIDRSPLVDEEYFKTKPKNLNSDQHTALAKIHEGLEKHLFQSHLLHGVTGSGKTEVYLQAIDKALSLGKGTLMLVPEIALTAQTIERFRSRFDNHIAILHHRLSQGERFDEWNRIKRGDANIVIGARSAIFSPIQNLGLIIVDEEHEPSYKQTEESPCYNARDVAVMRAKLSNSLVILGSATPSLESYYNATQGKYILSTLHARADAASIPSVTIVDMGKEYDKAKGVTLFSDTLLEKIKQKISLGEQCILFLNRRGYHTTLLCTKCHHTVKCNHCDVCMTFHKGENSLACHLCNYTLSPPPSVCPGCGDASTMKFRGIGTELAQKALQAIFPDIHTMRMDADTTRHKGSHQKLLKEFGSGKADVLIGTQMIAKGLHFPQVTLVGILNSDVALNIPDFRASEVVFQLLTQVTGRAGRGALAGEVVIQTLLPDNGVIRLAAEQNYSEFFKQELAVRQLFGYPPFSNLIKLVFSGTEDKVTLQAAENMRHHLLQHLASTYEVQPAVPCAYAKVKDKYRYQFLVKGPQISGFTKALEKVKEQIKLPSSVKMLVDVNPLSTFF